MGNYAKVIGGKNYKIIIVIIVIIIIIIIIIDRWLEVKVELEEL